MVIHDMRNPTNSIEFAVKEVLRIMFQAMTGIGSENVAGAIEGPGKCTNE